MGNCNGSPNFTAIDGPLDADGDIVGYGACSRFLLVDWKANVIAGSCCISGHSTCNHLGILLRCSSRKYISTTRIHKLSRDTSPARCPRNSFRSWTKKRLTMPTLIAKLFSKIYIPLNHRTLTRKRRAEDLKKFVLTLSDQKSVIGLAALLRALANRCRVTMYEFGIVISRAWLSSQFIYPHLAYYDNTSSSTRLFEIGA